MLVVVPTLLVALSVAEDNVAGGLYVSVTMTIDWLAVVVGARSVGIDIAAPVGNTVTAAVPLTDTTQPARIRHWPTISVVLRMREVEDTALMTPLSEVLGNDVMTAGVCTGVGALLTSRVEEMLTVTLACTPAEVELAGTGMTL
jgi:hypothetical protein